MGLEVSADISTKAMRKAGMHSARKVRVLLVSQPTSKIEGQLNAARV
jgi:hypothetical protein